MSLSQPLQLNNELMALKDYYQANFAEFEGKANLTIEQIKHVEALLVAQLEDSQQFVQSLIQLRSHLQTILIQHQQQAVHARVQLTHVHALLADELVAPQPPISISAATSQQQQLPPSQAVPQTEESHLDSSQVKENTVSSAPELEEPPSVLDSVEPTQVSPAKTQMLPQYQNLSKIQAVERLLRENAGTILHIDYIIRALYGELDASEIEAEKPQMYDTLTQGLKKGLWAKVPDDTNCYTHDLKLVQPLASKKSNSSRRQRRLSPVRGKRQEQMLPEYRHLNFTAAVEKVVKKYAGEILTTEKVAKELYGNLSGRELTVAKDKIGKTLWSGTKNERWQNVPGKLGCYTLDMSLVISHS